MVCNNPINGFLGYSNVTSREYDVRSDGRNTLQQSCECLLPPFKYRHASALDSDFRVLLTRWKPGIRDGSSRASGALQRKARYGECTPGLSRTLAVMFRTSQAYLHASAERDPVGGDLASPNRRGVSRKEAIASSSVMPICHSTTPMSFGKPTDLYSRRMQQLHELCPDELGAVVRANALHRRRDTRSIDVRQEPVKRR